MKVNTGDRYLNPNDSETKALFNIHALQILTKKMVDDTLNYEDKKKYIELHRDISTGEHEKKFYDSNPDNTIHFN